MRRPPRRRASSRPFISWSPSRCWRANVGAMLSVVAFAPLGLTYNPFGWRKKPEVTPPPVEEEEEDLSPHITLRRSQDVDEEDKVFGDDVTHVLEEGEEYTPVTVTNIEAVIITLLAGGLGGAVAKTLIAPMDFSKRNYHVHHTDEPYSLRTGARVVWEAYKAKGVSVIYKGSMFQLLRAIPFAAIQFTAHQEWKRYLDVTPDSPAGLVFKAGALAGVTALSITYPIDLVLAQMFVLEHEDIDTFFKALRNVWQRGKLFGLYRGFFPSLLGMVPYSGLSFFTYDSLKHQFLSPTHNNPSLFFMLFGATAGFVGQTVAYPFDTIRKHMQMATPLDTRYKTFTGTVLAICRTQGLRGFYEGLSIHWIKGPISVGATFATFDSILEIFKHPQTYEVSD